MFLHITSSKNRRFRILFEMTKKLFTFILFLSVFPCFSKGIVIGIINDNAHFFEHSHDPAMKRQRNAIINKIKQKLEKKFKHSKITIRHIDYDENKLSSAHKTISTQINTFKPDIIFGPFLDKSFYFLKDLIEGSNIPFIAFNHTSKLKKLKNYYTPFEWDSTSVKVILEKAKKVVNKRNPKIGAFVKLTDEHSNDTYETLNQILGKKLFALKLIHSKLEDYWNYKNKLDIDIKKMSNYSPDIIFNSNSNDIEELSSLLIIKMIGKGYDGIFLDTGTWPCTKLFFKRSKGYLRKMTKTSFGYTVRQKKCHIDLNEAERKFRNVLVEDDDKYYSMSGLFYKMAFHVLEAILKSNLPINSNNIQEIIKNNSFFKGFSGEKYNLFKTKESPEFLNIYKYKFQKEDLKIEKVPM